MSNVEQIKNQCIENVYEIIKNGKLKSQQQDFFNKRIISKWTNFYNNFKIIGTCFFRGCDKPTIKNSHTITNSNCLKTISESNHLLQPQYHYFKKSIELQKVGINEASTFPGFCEDHENTFKEFETHEIIDESSLMLYQSYRVICREIHFYEVLLKCSNSINQYYQKLLNQEANDLYKKELLKKNLNSECLQSLDFNITNRLLGEINSTSKEHIKYISRLKKFKCAYDCFMNTDNNNQGLQYKGVKYKYKLPVAMGGCAQVRFNKSKVFVFTLNVVPINNYTYVFIKSDDLHIDFFNKMVEIYFNNPLKTLSLIESFMIYGSDNWFISPKYWDSIPGTTRNNILKNLNFSPDFNFKELPFSIFEDVKKIMQGSQ